MKKVSIKLGGAKTKLSFMAAILTMSSSIFVACEKEDIEGTVPTTNVANDFETTNNLMSAKTSKALELIPVSLINPQGLPWNETIAELENNTNYLFGEVVDDIGNADTYYFEREISIEPDGTINSFVRNTLQQIVSASVLQILGSSQTTHVYAVDYAEEPIAINGNTAVVGIKILTYKDAYRKANGACSWKSQLNDDVQYGTAASDMARCYNEENDLSIKTGGGAIMRYNRLKTYRYGTFNKNNSNLSPLVDCSKYTIYYSGCASLQGFFPNYILPNSEWLKYYPSLNDFGNDAIAKASADWPNWIYRYCLGAGDRRGPSQGNSYKYGHEFSYVHGNIIAREIPPVHVGVLGDVIKID